MEYELLRKILKSYRYDLYDKLGEGGGGAVYRAHDLRSGFLVAIKVLPGTHFRNDIMRRKFIAEANRYLHLEHLNIVSLRDFIVTDEAYFLVMEFVDGKTIEQYINTVSGPIGRELTLSVVSQALSALSYAHQNGTVHLDIKPANIMISERGGYKQVKVLDFGISVSKDELGGGMEYGGTPMYMSPEQTVSKGVDWRSDIYSMGVTLYHMVTGRLPYYGCTTKEDVYQLVRTQPLPRVHDIYPHINANIQTIIDKATQKNKTDRYQTCDEFAIHLADICAR